MAHRCANLRQLIDDRAPAHPDSETLHSITRSLMDDRSVLLVAPRPFDRDLPWQLAAKTGCRPVLVVSQSDTRLAERAEALAESCGLIACHMRSGLPEQSLTTMADGLGAGRWDCAFVSVRHLADPGVMAAARAFTPRLVVIEDADRLPMPGPACDPAYQRAALLARDAGCVLTSSEVASEQTLAEIERQMAPHRPRVYHVGDDLRGLRLVAHLTASSAQKDTRLLGLLDDAPRRVVVFAADAEEAERLRSIIEGERGLPSLDLSAVRRGEIEGALRRFREGGARVLIATAPLNRRFDLPEIPLVISYSLPSCLETLHRQASLAGGTDATAVLMADPAEQPRLEEEASRAAPEVGHILGIHQAVAQDGDLNFTLLRDITGLSSEALQIGIEFLIAAGALEVQARADEEIVARCGPRPNGAALERYAREADRLRRTRVSMVEPLLDFARTRRCRRAFLAEALGYPLTPGGCRCDRCRPAPEPLAPVRTAGYRIFAGPLVGWALSLWRGHDDGPPPTGAALMALRLGESGSNGAAERLAWLLVRRMRNSSAYRHMDLIVPLPPLDGAAEDDGALQLATALSRLTGLAVAPMLHRKNAQPRREGRASREANDAADVAVVNVADTEHIRGQRIVLLANIFRLDAEAEKVAAALLRAGAAKVRLLAVLWITPRPSSGPGSS